MNSQDPAQQNILISTLPPLRELTGYTFRINQDNHQSIAAHFSTQQLARYIARTVPSFLVAPADQTSLILDYSESKKLLVIITSSVAKQTDSYEEKLKELRLVDRNSFEIDTRILQECYRFTLYSRLSPKWNRFGTMLVQGQSFLSGNKTNTVLAVKLESNMQSGDLCLAILPYTITFRPLNLTEVLSMYQGMFVPDTPQSLQLLLGQDLSRMGLACQILPNLTRGYVHSVTTHPLKTSPLQDYPAVCEYWKSVHGYELPQGTADCFVNVSFQSKSSRALTYPLSCVLTERSVVWRYSPASAAEVVGSFLQDTNKRVTSLCGSQVSLSPRVHPSVPLQLQTDSVPTQHNTNSNYYKTHTPVENTALLRQSTQLKDTASQYMPTPTTTVPIPTPTTTIPISTPTTTVPIPTPTTTVPISTPTTTVPISTPTTTVPISTPTTTVPISTNTAAKPISTTTTASNPITNVVTAGPTGERYKPIFKTTPKFQDITNKQTTHSQSNSKPIKPVFSLPSTPKPSEKKVLTESNSNLPNFSSNTSTSTSHSNSPPPSSPTTQPPPAKKQRVIKPTAGIEELIRAEQLEKANVASLSGWLREKKITFKSKDKKAQLIALVRQHIALMSES